MTYISRDPFARTELHRRLEDDTNGMGCNWCGQPRMNHSHPRPRKLRLFKYYTESDGGRSSDHRGLFCSKSCHDSYHGV